jgi:hypothetical protein
MFLLFSGVRERLIPWLTAGLALCKVIPMSRSWSGEINRRSLFSRASTLNETAGRIHGGWSERAQTASRMLRCETITSHNKPETAGKGASWKSKRARSSRSKCRGWMLGNYRGERSAGTIMIPFDCRANSHLCESLAECVRRT